MVDKPGWRFAQIPDDQVAPDVTQRDQFNNDSVEPYQALVREAIQNSMDQRLAEGAVRLRFAIKTLSQPESSKLRELMIGLRPHCEICKLEAQSFDQTPVRVLAVEDFNTTGLIGSIDSHDDGNFAGFWRRHGGSNKNATKSGSHGLGKLVFSASSMVGAIFGHTIRADGQSLLMGQAILNNHKLGGIRYPAHGYWTPTSKPGSIQLPVADASLISEIGQLLGLTRKTETGLSVAVPYLSDDIDEPKLLRAVVTNYFFPIMSGDLIVQVGSQEVRKDNFQQVVAGVSGVTADERHRLQFVQELLPLLAEIPANAPDPSHGTERFEEAHLPEGAWESLRSAYSAGQIVSVRVPVTVRPKGGSDQKTFVDVYLRKKPDDASPWALFARNSLVLPGENRASFGDAAFAALIARDHPVCALLRDAENPAHTKWNAHERVKKNWRYGEETIRNIRLCVSAFFRALTSQLREEHRDLLLDFLSIKDPSAKASKSKKTRSKPPVPPPPPAPRFFAEKRVEGGFRIGPGEGASTREYPVRVRIRVAYDVLSGNPFTSHSPFDFDLTKSDIALTAHNVVLVDKLPGTIVLDCTDRDFAFQATGFDANRDLIIDPRVVT